MGELDAPWTAYRLWSCTAKYNKRLIDNFTSWSLALAIGGSVGATLAEQVKSAPTAVNALRIGATAAIALAAFLSKQAQGGNRVDVWTRSRAAAESIKSGIYLYRARAIPFDGSDRAVQMTQRMEKLIKAMQGVEPRQPASEIIPGLGPLKVDEYIKDRVRYEIEWYNGKAREHQGKSDLYRHATTILLGIGVLLTVASTIKGVSVWVPVVATITASLTAHMKNQQYQMLTATYSATSLRLTTLLTEWSASGKTEADKAERNAFVQRCEDTMSAENGGWAALWAKKE